MSRSLVTVVDPESGDLVEAAANLFAFLREVDAIAASAGVARIAVAPIPMTGLGLAIAREDAAVHGGLLEVWSRLGGGSNFRLTLPRGDETNSFVSPVPLVPDDVTPELGDPEVTGGWLRRPGRRVRRERNR